MNNIITIYKLKLPFLADFKYDHSKCESITEDMRKLLIYHELFISSESKNWKDIDIYTLKFTFGYIKIITFKILDNYSLPSFQIDLFSDKEMGPRFIIDFIEIFNSSWLDDYIFDYIPEKFKINNYHLLTINSLKNDFNEFNEEKLEYFFKNIDLNYIEHALEKNKKIRNNLYYLIFLNYVLFKNLAENKKELSNIKEIIGTNISEEFLLELSLIKERLSFIYDINIETFKKYRTMIYYFFDLLKK